MEFFGKTKEHVEMVKKLLKAYQLRTYGNDRRYELTEGARDIESGTGSQVETVEPTPEVETEAPEESSPKKRPLAYKYLDFGDNDPRKYLREFFDADSYLKSNGRRRVGTRYAQQCEDDMLNPWRSEFEPESKGTLR